MIGRQLDRPGAGEGISATSGQGILTAALRRQDPATAARRRGRQLDHAQAQDVGVLSHGFQGLAGGDAVEVDHADGLAPLVLAADVHLGDVDSLVAERPADEADQAGPVHVGEDQERSVDMGVEQVRPQPDQAEELLAEEGARRRRRSCARW